MPVRSVSYISESDIFQQAVLSSHSSYPHLSQFCPHFSLSRHSHLDKTQPPSSHHHFVLSPCLPTIIQQQFPTPHCHHQITTPSLRKAAATILTNILLPHLCPPPPPPPTPSHTKHSPLSITPLTKMQQSLSQHQNRCIHKNPLLPNPYASTPIKTNQQQNKPTTHTTCFLLNLLPSPPPSPVLPVMMYHPIMFGCKRISNSKDIVGTVTFWW